MNFTLILLLAVTVISFVAGQDLDDISFDDDESPSHGLSDVSNDDESHSSVFAKTEDERRAMLKKVLGAAFEKPGAKTRLGQVLPIVRLMTPPQRLALASLVMAQVMADPKDPLPPVSGSKNMTSQLMLPISMDIATMFRGLAKEQEKAKSEGRSASALSGMFPPHRIAMGPNIRRPPPVLNGISRRNANIPSFSEKQGLPKRRPLRPLYKLAGKTNSTTKRPSLSPPSCTSMSNNLCMELPDYPEEAILNSLKKETNHEIFKILKSEPSQMKEGEQKPKVLERRQSDSVEPMKKDMCSSTLELARPKKARATSGQWKYIVNTGDYTQTLRLELCTQPQTPCLFLADDMDSTCEQVFNYHRLLTWDEASGLTMDVFKVPTCCSCKVLGYGGLAFSSPTTAAPAVTHPSLPSFENPDVNLVPDDESTAVRVPAPPPLPPQLPPILTSPSSHNNKKQGIRVRPYSPPNRRPTVQHRGPPLPLEGETLATDDTRYPPFENNLRRITRNHTSDNSRINFPHLLMPPSPNSRHPALPIDSIDSESAPSNTYTAPTPSTSAPTKRINYSYHPIIDYFRPQTAASTQKPQACELKTKSIAPAMTDRGEL